MLDNILRGGLSHGHEEPHDIDSQNRQDQDKKLGLRASVKACQREQDSLEQNHEEV
jgi:hypothetical protein